MASTYTTNLGIEKPGVGEQTGTWGDTANTNYDLIDQAITGIAQTVLAAAGSSGSPNTLPITDGASSVGRNAFIEFIDGGDLGGDAYVQLTPNDAERVIRFRNSLSASRSIYIFQGTYSASNDFVLPNGCDAVIKLDGGGASATATDANQNAFLTGVTFGGQYTEAVYELSGTSAALDPDNGTIQTHTLTGNTTYTDSISAGQSVIIMINDGTDYSVTWPTTTWVNNSGVAPTLAITGYTVIALWKVGSTLYAANVGNG